MRKVFESQTLGFLPDTFNKKKKRTQKFFRPANENFLTIHNLSKKQCHCKTCWFEPKNIFSLMISAETGTFMKWGGLGMIASELPDCFNKCFLPQGDEMAIVTPMYIGDTGKKKASLNGNIYEGAEGVCVKVAKISSFFVNFINQNQRLEKNKVDVYKAKLNNVTYIFLENNRFFSINAHKENISAQDGCYVMNEFGVDEVERFAFFSKAVYMLLKTLADKPNKEIKFPNSIIANDWHTGALAGLLKYFSTACFDFNLISDNVKDRLFNLPIVYIIHNLDYQGWSYNKTPHLLNSLYEDMTVNIFKSAKAVKNTNPRLDNCLIVADCYNQSAPNLLLADRVVTVSKNYQEEVSKDLSFGQDFRDILKIRKDHRTFFGIVNGYDKKLISPNAEKIAKINKYFGSDFKVFDEKNLEIKQDNKKEFIKLISKIASDKDYKEKTIPLIDAYKFENISKNIKKFNEVPIICATSRLVEQKGYDIAANAIVQLIKEENYTEPPIFLLGGAGDLDYFNVLTKLKDEVAKISPLAAERIFVFRGYKDEFAYAIQLASDFYLMPCRFEPCGLTQMEAMAKGALPIAMSTGGLVDTIIDDVDGFRTNAFFGTKYHVFGNNVTAKRLKSNDAAYLETLRKALRVFYHGRSILNQMTYNAVAKDFSWDVKETGSVYKYHKLLKTGHI